MTTKFVASHPTFSTHKGTPIRYFIRFTDGSHMLVEPLRTHAAGLVLRATDARKYLRSAKIVDGVISLLNSQGEVVGTVEAGSTSVESIEATVVYPDGRTWEGNILGGSEAAVSLLVWDWDLARTLSHQNVAELFMFGNPWYEVPTTVAFFDDSVSPSCGHSHACPKQCTEISKFL